MITGGAGWLYLKGKRALGFKDKPLKVVVSEKSSLITSNEPPKSTKVTLSRDDYEAQLAKAIEVTELKLQTAHDDEKTQLNQQIEVFKQRAVDPETALQEARETIAELEKAFKREGNEIGEARMAEASAALEDGDFTLAADIFEEIQAREDIAKQDIRWHDAMKHFETSASRDPTFSSCDKAGKLNWQTGNYDKAIAFVSQMQEFAATEEEKSFVLNSLGLLYEAREKYDLAEPLFLQASKIWKTALRVYHPNTKIVRGNYERFLASKR